MKKILIVDDEEIVRRALQRVFSKLDIEIHLAVDGIDALQKWAEVNPDLVLLDVLMPGKSGIQVLEEMGKQEHCKVVLMSAYSGEYNLQKAKALGAQMFIPKPFEDIHELKLTVESLLSG